MIVSEGFAWFIPSPFSRWYAHYDGNPSFSDFQPFGELGVRWGTSHSPNPLLPPTCTAGWTHPAIKQYQGTTSLCGAGVDESWYPDGFNSTFRHRPTNKTVVA